MRLKFMLVSMFVLGVAAGGTGASPKAANSGTEAKSKCQRCSPAFPGSIPQCAGSGGTDGSGTSGSGGTGGP
jgi:hypothetical protein